MKTMLAALLTLGLVAGCSSEADVMQEPSEGYQLPVFTDEQLWSRAALLSTVTFALYLGELQDQGLSVSEAGQELASILAPGWAGIETASGLFNGMYRNWSSTPGTTCEVAEASEETVQARCNRPYADFFAQSGGELYGMTLAEWEEMMSAFNRDIAASVGMTWRQEFDDTGLSVTITKGR
jgi:hypothetical protein